MYAAADGQWAATRLLSSEQFGFGGQRFGRAYDASEFTADNGVAGLLELRYYDVPDLGPFSVLPFLSADAGLLWDDDAESDAITAASVAIGFRYATNTGFSGQVLTAAPLHRPASAAFSESGYGPRVFFSISYRF